jgi:hypothetical protein
LYRKGFDLLTIRELAGSLKLVEFEFIWCLGVFGLLINELYSIMNYGGSSLEGSLIILDYSIKINFITKCLENE